MKQSTAYGKMLMNEDKTLDNLEKNISEKEWSYVVQVSCHKSTAIKLHESGGLYFSCKSRVLSSV